MQETMRNRVNYDHAYSLEILVKNFRDIVSSQNLVERSFIVFYGHLQYEDQERSFEIKISFIKQDLIEYILLILRDTTQRDLLITLESNNKYKDHLLALVSHELRAPLNGTINFLEAALQAKEVPSNIRDSFLDPALRSSKLNSHLINDILDTSQITAQKVRLVSKRL